MLIAAYVRKRREIIPSLLVFPRVAVVKLTETADKIGGGQAGGLHQNQINRATNGSGEVVQ